MSAVIFDLDGTLVDSAPDLASAANVLLGEKGLAALPLQTIAGFIGNGIPKLVERALLAHDIQFNENEFDQHVARFMEIYGADPAGHGRLYPGVETALETLIQSHEVGICTNKAAAMTEKVVRAYGLDRWITHVISGDSLPVKKPDPAPLFALADQMGAPRDSVIYVGDSETDAETARRAQVPFFLYRHGYRKTPVSELPHKAVFDHFDALPDLLAP